MIRKPLCFVTYVSDEYYHSIGCDRLVRSIQYFYPDVPVVVYGDDVIQDFHIRWGLLHPFVINKALKEYEKVIYLDADSLLVGNLNELIIKLLPERIIGVRNNNDFGGAGKDKAITQDGISWENYYNAGLIATGNQNFINDWMEKNIEFGYLLPFMEQTVMNVLTRKYNGLFHMIDAIDTNVYYGVSSLSGIDSHWESWKDMAVENGEIKLNNKTVKILHHAGGFRPDKMQFYMFNKQVRNRLIEITK